MKIILILIITGHYSYVNSQNNTEILIIPSKSVGNYILGEKLKHSYNEQELEIKTQEGIIKEIIVKSSKYRTKDGFGVGTKFKKIKSRMGDTQKELKMSKDNVSIGKVVYGLFYKGIWFIDTNKDNVVDGIWLVE
ncbi:MAG: hypothetical protein GKR88_01380 [Flavobacteriaceae bacterium]|nr:MAG: hypothetical protein GKR88_01380 [Flavobacteriaceae bacterium]